MAELRDLSPNPWEDPKTVRREIEASEQQRNRLLAPLKEMLEKYEGPGRRDDIADSYDRENHYFEWVSLVLPQTLFRNPKVNVSSKRPSVSQWDAIAVEHALNRWIKDTHYIRYLERLGVDWCFSYGVGMVTVESYGGDFDDPRQRPRTIYLDPGQFGMDSLARSWEESRFMFHKCVEVKRDLLRRAKAEDGWDMEALESLATEQDMEGVGRPKPEGGVNRNEVAYWDVWVPELNDDDDETHHGKILTLGMCVGGEYPQSKFLRKPRRYYGPRWGPYTLFGAYSVPRSAWPMGPLQAHEGHNRELNLHARANSISASRRKTVLLYNESNKETASKILKSKDGEGVGIPGFEKQMFDVFQTPGVTEDALAYEQWKRGALERVSGLNDRAKGQVEGGGTATADAIAQRGSDARMSYLEQKLYDATKRQLQTVAWFYWNNDMIVEPIPDDAKQEIALAGGPDLSGVEANWEGGPSNGPFDDLELDIEPYSMQRVDEAGMQARAMQMFQTLLQAAPLIPQTPWMPWRQTLDHLGKVMNWPDVGEGVNMDLANQVAQMMLQMQAMPENANKPREGPRLSTYSGGRGSNGGQPTGTSMSRMARPSEMGKVGQNPMSGYSAGRRASLGSK